MVQFVSYDSENDVGGVSSWLHQTVLYLRRQGIDARVDLFSFGDKPGSNAEWYRKNNVPFRVSPWVDDSEKTVRQCLLWLREAMPQVYVPNCMLPAYFAAAEARRCGARTIGVLHADDPFYWGVVDEFVLGDKKWRLDEVVVVSRFLHEALRSRGATMPVHEIPCGVAVHQEKVTAPTKTFRIVYAGRLVEKQKRISDLTRAFCLVAREHPELEAWIVGAGPDESSVRNIIQTEGMENRVILKGRVEPEAIHDVLKECHAFVLLSDFEGTPVALMEAMSLGLVPICLETSSGVGELISHMKNGILVQNREDSFSTAISSLIENRVRWSALSAAAQQTIKERYSEDICMEKWKTVLLAHPSKISPDSRSRLRLKLPPQNPKFGYTDHRPPGQVQKTWNQFRGLAGSVRRKAMNLVRPTSQN
jgi:colanic acid/amylovoran biosynthesis glycosyltransferase